MENMLKNKKEFVILLKDFTHILDDYLKLPPSNGFNSDDLRKFLFKSTNKNTKNRKIAIKFEYLESNESPEAYKELDIVEDGNSKLLRICMLCLNSLKKKDKISTEELIYAYDRAFLALDCLASSINKVDEKLETEKDQIKKRYTELVNGLYGTKTEIKESNYPRKNCQKKISSLICNPCFNIQQIHIIFNDLLAYINEGKSTNEKIISYINDIFVFLLLVFFRQRISEKEITLENWLTVIRTNVIENNEGSLEKQDYLSIKNITTNTLVEYLWRRDIQFWFKIIKCSLNTPWTAKDVISTNLTEEINHYRNMAAHTSGNAVGTKWLIRTLRTIISFTKSLEESNAEWNIESALLEKRLAFEIYNDDIITRKAIPIKKYGDIIFNFKFNLSPIPSWKNILRLKKYNHSKIIDNSSRLETRAKILTDYFFEKLTGKENDRKNNVIERIRDYYNQNRIIFPFWINGNAFKNLMIKCYPFSPMFLLLTKNIDINDVIIIAKECINNAITSTDDSPIIMPYDINFHNPSFEKILTEYYTAGYSIDSSFSIHTDSHYFTWLENDFFKKDSIWCKRNAQRVAPDVFSKVAKSIVLLSTDEMKKCYHDIPSRDWIRLCSCQPGKSNEEIEKSLEIVRSFSLYSLPDEPFDFISPITLKETMKKMFCIIDSRTNIFSFRNEDLSKIEKNFEQLFKESNNHTLKEHAYISIKGCQLIKELFKDSERSRFKSVLNNLTPDTIAFFTNLVDQGIPLGGWSLENATEEELNHFASLFGECSAVNFNEEAMLRAQVAQYLMSIWYYNVINTDRNETARTIFMGD